MESRHACPDGFHHARRLVAEQIGEVVADAAFPVVQVGVADAARLDPDQRLPGSRIRDKDRGEFYRSAFAAGDDAGHLMCHRARSLR
jgi:hypothetical protein